MNKKELRKELEAAIEKNIAETLNTRNAIAGKKITKAVHEASKTIAKKFYKTLKAMAEVKAAPAKKAVKKTAATSEKKAPAKKTSPVKKASPVKKK